MYLLMVIFVIKKILITEKLQEYFFLSCWLFKPGVWCQLLPPGSLSLYHYHVGFKDIVGVNESWVDRWRQWWSAVSIPV